ncbi:PIG-L family deacetylase [Amycolatopsis sp. NPDC058986]|uniref:PIG-L family deacetylase n=1 Tax=unclassified Amycolatopsis TaxID=2618356 RepID=UPI00366D4D4A
MTRLLPIAGALIVTTSVLVATPMIGAAQAVPAATTLTFSSHEDDDLLFMSPDITSDVQAGYAVWIVYLTAGETPPGDLAYADKRIQGERAAYARAAHRANQWTYEPMSFGGHDLATNRLNGTNVHLVFTFVHAADGGHGDPCGDLFRMLHLPAYVAQPIDGRAPYTKDSFVGMLGSIIDTIRPDYIRTHNSLGHRDPAPNTDHVDHISGAILSADADADAAGSTKIRRDEYLGYIIRTLPDNVFGYWRDEKTAVWKAYQPLDTQTFSTSWSVAMGRQYRPEGRIFFPGARWVPPDDFTSC